MRAINYATKHEAEFARTLNLTKGRGNNNTICDLISEFDCTAEDVEKVANKTKNKHLTDTNEQYSRTPYATIRALHKIQYCKKHVFGDIPNIVPMSDYAWYFKYTPSKYFEDRIVSKKHMDELLNKNMTMTDDSFRIYAYNKVATLVNGNNYPDKFFTDRLRENKTVYNNLIEPYPLTHIKRVYDGSSVYVEHPYYYVGKNIVSTNNWNYEEPGNARHTTDTEKKQLLDLVAQIKVLCTVMDGEMLDGDTMDILNAKKFGGYYEYLAGSLYDYRKTGHRRSMPQKTRLELFGQVKALEMLLAMGLGIKRKDDSGSNWDIKTSNKRLNKRVQTAYKQFIKAKTVDDRKNIRTLLKRQLEVICNDFMRQAWEVVELKCIEKQDENFENGVAFTKKITPKSNANGFVARKVDLSELLKAKTVVVDKARH